MKRILSLALVLVLCIGVLTIGASAADADYSTCPGVAVEITVYSSITQNYTFSRTDGGSISASEYGTSTTITSSGISYGHIYKVLIPDEGTFEVTIQGTFGGTMTVTVQVEHTVVTDRATAATCTQSGLTEGSHCSVCGEVLVAQETIPATGHTVVTDEGSEATCTSDGLTEGSHCSVCGEVLVAQEVIPGGHEWDNGETTTEASCAEDGEMTYICTVCGETKNETIDALGHEWNDGEATIEATCTEDGEMTFTCSRCGETYNESIEALGHTWNDGEITIEATETSEGEMTFTCSVCGETKTETIPVITPEPTHIPGDINDDGTVNISDVQTLLKYVNGQSVSVNDAALDVNGDATVNISDVQTLLKSVNGQEVTIL